MKRKIMILIFAFFVIVGCSPKTLANFVTVSIETVEQKVNDKESFVLFLSSPTCPYCQDTKKHAFAYLKIHTDQVLFTMDVKDISTATRQEFAQMVYLLLGEAFYVASGLSSQNLYVPTTILYENGIATRAKIGVITENEYIQWLF